MKFTIKANNGINDIKINKNTENQITSIEIDFNTNLLWSDLEFWLNNNKEEFLDYAKMNISQRNKMKFFK